MTRMRMEAGDEAVDDVLLNKLIQGLCNARDQSFDFDVTLDVVDELFESKVRFMPATVAALCATMLRRHDVEGVSDLLDQLLSTFGAHDKAKIREPLLAFINDATQPVGEAWDVYELVNNLFPDTPVAQRTQIMQTFFRRGYAHQATLVFGHMRAKNLGEQRPTATTYTECLLGIAGARDEGALGMVHNMLKMDLEIKLDTRLLNALMFAYTCCGEPGTALEQFKQILHSEEGPSEATILVFFRTCEIYDEGAGEARRMMLNLRSLEIPVGRKMYEAFMAALMGNGDMHGAIDAVRSMEAQVGERPDAVTLATLYNVAPFQMVKKQIEDWCQSTYPDLWSQVGKLGYETDMFGTKTYKIDRGIEI
ncbi:hypothetical protein KEM55_003653 [Ascosphaera atra]|nr:hypothetical protein KEM55_003653 [Ascosphaera atra]